MTACSARCHLQTPARWSVLLLTVSLLFQASNISTAAALPQASTGAAAPWFPAQACPPWMLDYATWHSTNKHAASTRYLLYQCKIDGSDCSFGLGDRLRGIMFLARMAAYTQRVLLVDVPSPLPFTNLFVPSTFDWRVGNVSVNPGAPGGLRYIAANELRPAANNGTLHAITERYLVTQGSAEMHVMQVGKLPPPLYDWTAPRCLWRLLFKPSHAVQEATALRLRQMGLSLQKPYVAIHIRLGGLVGESLIHRFDAVTALHHGLRCARSMAAAHGLWVQDIAVVTDNLQLKQLLLAGGLTGARTSAVLPVHLSSTARMQLKGQIYVDTVADMGILAGARYLVVDGGGGFGNQARLWGPADGIPAEYDDLRECIKRGLADYRTAMDILLLQPPAGNITIRRFAAMQAVPGKGWWPVQLS